MDNQQRSFRTDGSVTLVALSATRRYQGEASKWMAFPVLVWLR